MPCQEGGVCCCVCCLCCCACCCRCCCAGCFSSPVLELRAFRELGGGGLRAFGGTEEVLALALGWGEEVRGGKGEPDLAAAWAVQCSVCVCVCVCVCVVSV